MEQVRPWKSCRARGFLNFRAGSFMVLAAASSSRGLGDFLVGGSDFGLDHLVEVMLQGLGAFADGVHDGAFAGGAVGFENGAVEAEQGRAAAVVRVGAADDGADGVFGEQAAEDALGVFGDFILEPASQALGETFQRL